MCISKSFFVLPLFFVSPLFGNDAALAAFKLIRPNTNSQQSKAALKDNLTAEQKLEIMVSEHKRQIPILKTLFEDGQMVQKMRYAQLQEMQERTLVFQEIKKQGLGTFQAQLEPNVAFIIVHSLLIEHFKNSNDLRTAQALAASVSKTLENMHQNDEAFQTKLAIYLALFAENPRFINRQKSELQRVSTELATKMKVECPSFEQLIKKSSQNGND